LNSKGRAKKRLTYTRRFVNITLTGGKRKVGLVRKPREGETRDTHTLRTIDEPQPRLLNHPPQSIKSGRPWRHLDRTDDATGNLAQGRWGQGLVKPMGSIGGRRDWGIAKSPGGSHFDSGFRGAWHVISHSGNGKRFHGIFATRPLYMQTTLDREYPHILCNHGSLVEG
jgi:hypothetical protein